MMDRYAPPSQECLTAAPNCRSPGCKKQPLMPTCALCRSCGGLLSRTEIQSQVIAGVREADVANHVSDEFHVVWHFAVLHVGAEQVAEHAPKVFVARIRHEGT